MWPLWHLLRAVWAAFAPATPVPDPTPRLDPRRPDWFPDPLGAPSAGVVALGGDLSVPRLLAAYRRGFFPYYEAGPILWWSPDPRAVFDLDDFHVGRRLARTARSGKFRVTFDIAFGRVIRGCADRDEGTWINPDMVRAYDALHAAGHAHSVEAWQGDELAGGIYGVAIGGMFAGESMFSRTSDASKVALVALAERLRERGYTLFDVQILNPHTASLGARETSRAEYLRRLAEAVRSPVTFG